MNGTRDYYIKGNKSETERQIPYYITYMCNLKYDTNETIYKTETDSQIQRTGLEFGKRKRRERDGLGVWGSR